MAGFNLFKRLLGESERRVRDRVLAPAGTRMLVVDDSPTIRAVLAKMLIQDGYAVIKAGDGESAIQIARDERPDLIFLDIVLPGLNGFAVLRELRRNEATKTIPIVMISGNLQATEQFYVQRFGADDFMKKPFGRGEVFGRIQQLVESDRLPRRSTVDDESAEATGYEGMEHVPDVALPDDALAAHERGPAADSGLQGDGVADESEVPSGPSVESSNVEPLPASNPPVTDSRASSDGRSMSFKGSSVS